MPLLVGVGMSAHLSMGGVLEAQSTSGAAVAGSMARTAVPLPTDKSRRRLTARRTTTPILVDGRLDEPAWLTAPEAQAFSQVRPEFVAETRYPSTVRILFDRDHLYVGAFNHDSAGLAALRMQDLRRDFDSNESDLFGVTLGPLGDGRTAYQFQVSPLGSLADVQAFDGGDVANTNWDALWRARTTRSDSGWVVEMAIPWRSLRYAPGRGEWELNLVRNTRRALQWSAWAPYPRQLSSWRLTYAGVLDSVAPPPPRTNIRVRPYVLAQGTRDGALREPRRTTGDVGGEVIWAPTANSVLEGTLNTDSAQAEVDRQVVNLTRFNVFFPEQRQFFLENADLLSGGGVNVRYVVQPFFTRRIGLADDGTPIPLDGGARYAYRTGRTTAGAMVMRQRGQGDLPASTFGVARASRFFGRSTRVALLTALRQDDAIDSPLTARVQVRNNVVTSLDAVTRIGEQVQFNGTLSTSTDSGRTGVAVTWFASRTSPSTYMGYVGALVTRDYAPRTGFVSRPNVLMSSPAVSWNAQPAWRPRGVVWFKPGITTYFYQDPDSRRLQEGVISSYVEVLQTNGGTTRLYHELDLQRPEQELMLFPGVRTPAGRHDYQRVGIDARSDQSARATVTGNLSTGGFFDGALDRAALTARWSPNPFVALRGSYELNRLRDLGTRDSSFVTHLAGPELRVFASPRLQWSAFYQYNTAQGRGTLNTRFSWEYRPLSFVHVVYNDRQPVSGYTGPVARSLLVKVSWLGQL